MKKSFKVIAILLTLFVIASASFYITQGPEMLETLLQNTRNLTKLEVKENELHMSNFINSQTFDQVQEVMEENPQIDTIVERNMPGSLDDDTMIKLAYFVREKNLKTKLLRDSSISSGAVDLFLAGVERTMERGAQIGVHSWSDGEKDAKDYPRDSEEHIKNSKYIEKMLGKDDFYWFTIQAAPGAGMHQMTEKEILKYGLLTQPIIE